MHCAAEEIPAHEHQQTLFFVNWNTSALWSIHHNWQLGLTVPVMVRELGINYVLVDERNESTGERFVPSYAGLHHRDETLFGVGDAELSVQHFRVLGKWSFAASMGSSVPIGKIEADPYALAAESQVHQHFQLGTGVFSPIVNVNITRQFGRSGLLIRGQTRLSFYENGNGFQPGDIHGATFGGWHRFTQRFTLLSGATIQHDEADRWFALRAPYSGHQNMGGHLAMMWRVAPQVELLFRLDQNILERSLTSDLPDEGDAAPLRTMLTIGLSWL